MKITGIVSNIAGMSSYSPQQLAYLKEKTEERRKLLEEVRQRRKEAYKWLAKKMQKLPTSFF